jgi:hypothetical protein
MFIFFSLRKTLFRTYNINPQIESGASQSSRNCFMVQTFALNKSKIREISNAEQICSQKVGYAQQGNCTPIIPITETDSTLIGTVVDQTLEMEFNSETAQPQSAETESSPSTPVVGQTFTKFPELPLLPRWRIWEHCCNNMPPRNVVLQIDEYTWWHDDSFYKEDMDSGISIAKPYQQPLIFSLSREARHEGLRHYKRILENDYQEPGLYINLVIDRLAICSYKPVYFCNSAIDDTTRIGFMHVEMEEAIVEINRIVCNNKLQEIRSIVLPNSHWWMTPFPLGKLYYGDEPWGAEDMQPLERTIPDRFVAADGKSYDLVDGHIPFGASYEDYRDVDDLIFHHVWYYIWLFYIRVKLIQRFRNLKELVLITENPKHQNTSNLYRDGINLLTTQYQKNSCRAELQILFRQEGCSVPNIVILDCLDPSAAFIQGEGPVGERFNMLYSESL